MTLHAITITRHRVAFLGTRWRASCACNRFVTALVAAREAAQLAGEKHLWHANQEDTP